MIFRLFSKTEFEITYPVALIECYCFQTNFYSAYDLLIPRRQISDVAKIGARIDHKLYKHISAIVKANKNIPAFKHDLPDFLTLKTDAIQTFSQQASGVLEQLMAVGMGLSQATKVLHTVYPNIIPMIDSMLQEEYRRAVDPGWNQSQPQQILYAYYMNLQEEPNRSNLADLYGSVRENLSCLTMVRVFDIIWWSYLRSKKLTESHNIALSTISS